jgi:hypothetical protein
MTTNKDIYRAIWQRAENQGVRVEYRGETPACEAGYFHPTNVNGTGPVIVMFRPYYAGPADKPSFERLSEPRELSDDDVVRELCTLAHEFGHFESWRSSGDWSEYLAAVVAREDGRALSERERTLIIEEEERAWRLGREVLGALGFQDWEHFEACERAGLAEHRRRMAISPDRSLGQR